MKKQTGLPLLGLATVAVLAACGGGSGDGGRTGGGNVDASVETTELQRNAARNASTNLGASLGGIERLFNNAAPFADDFTNDDALEGGSDDAVGDGNLPDLSPVVDEAESMADTILHASLGLDDGGLAQASRSGSRVTIDPDDAAVCASMDPDLYDAGLVDTQTQTDRAHCEALVSRVIVQIDADTEESGLITYQFDQQPLLLVGYSPTEASFDLNLGTLREVAAAAESLEGESGGVPALVQGRYRVAVTASNQNPGQEAGSFSVSVPAAIRIVDDNMGIDISQAASSGFVLSADEASGTATVEIDYGAFNASVNLADEGATPSMAALSMPGFTGRLELLNDGSRLVVSRLGFGNGPLSFSIDNVELLSVALAPFGFSVDESDGVVVFDAGLDLAVALDLGGLIGEGDLDIEAMLQGPVGTRLLGGASGGDLVQSGGPLSFNYSGNVNGSTESGFTLWTVGGCEQSPAADEESSLSIGCD